MCIPLLIISVLCVDPNLLFPAYFFHTLDIILHRRFIFHHSHLSSNSGLIPYLKNHRIFRYKLSLLHTFTPGSRKLCGKHIQVISPACVSNSTEACSTLSAFLLYMYIAIKHCTLCVFEISTLNSEVSPLRFFRILHQPYFHRGEPEPF